MGSCLEGRCDLVVKVSIAGTHSALSNSQVSEGRMRSVVHRPHTSIPLCFSEVYDPIFREAELESEDSVRSKQAVPYNKRTTDIQAQI